MLAFSCVLEFDTSGSAFVRGVEIGRLWETLKCDDGEVEEIVHSSNAEMIMRVAEAMGREVQSEDLDETWIRVVFHAA